MRDQQTTRFHGMRFPRLTAVLLLLAIFAAVTVVPGTGRQSVLTIRLPVPENPSKAPSSPVLPPVHALAPIRIGVLAHKGTDICREMWQPTIDYLDKAMAGRRFELVPLPFEDVEPAVRNRSIDFLICNPAIYVDLEVRYGVTRTMTLRNLVGTQVVSEFGGVIFCLADRGDIQDLQDARGRRLAAAGKTSFGGWYMALREFRSAGIDPKRDCDRLYFLETHPAVVRAVLSGDADLGTVRTDTLERMAASGEIRMDAIRVIPAYTAPGPRPAFPYLHSTRLYPEWPLAKLSDTTEDLSRELTVALLSMPADSPAAMAAQSGGWGVCLNYTSVHDCLRELRMSPYEHYGQMSWPDMFRQYWPWLTAITALILALLGMLLLLHGRQTVLMKVSGQNLLLLASAGEGICGIDIHGITTFVNPAATKILGYTTGELLGKNLHALTHHTKPDGRPYPVHECPLTLSCSDGSVHRGSDEFFFRKDGSAIPIAYSSRPIVVKGRIRGAVICFQDITERKRAEAVMRESNELLSLFMKHSPFYTFIKEVTPTESRVRMASENFKDMIGIPGSEMIGKTMDALFPAEFAAKITADDWAVVTSGKALRLDEDLNDRNYTTVKFPICHRGKNLLAGFTIDITDRKQAEEQVRHLQKAESLGRMAGAIAHHFNNQLQAVMGNLEMALETMPSGAGSVQNLNEAMHAAHRAALVSGLMLTYLGQATGKRELLDLSEVCRRSMPMIQAAMPQDVILKTDFHAPGPTIRANANQIQQVLTNLIANAGEASPDGRGAVHLAVRTVSSAEIPASHRFPVSWQPEDNLYACLAVADTGYGIAAKDIGNLFDPFFSSKFTGRGMGLAVVLGIVRAHGGAVTVESEPGVGSVFQIFLPVSDEEAPVLPEQAEKTPEMEGGGTVLVVEDEEPVRNLVKAMLARMGTTALEARDGIEAVEMFRQHLDEIRYVVCDLTMPGMDGWDTLAALRRLSPGIPVILSSGYDEAQVMAGEHLERPDAFLGKPYQFKMLCDTISRILSGKDDSSGK